MSITNWLSRLLDAAPARTTAQPAAAAPLQQVLEVNVRNAIEVHQAWKRRLESAIRSGATFEGDPRVVGRDDVCPLGRWIHGAGGRQFGGDPQFVALRARHAAFHQCAAHALSLARAGAEQDALQELRASSDFVNLSWGVVGDLAAISSRQEGAHA